MPGLTEPAGAAVILLCQHLRQFERSIRILKPFGTRRRPPASTVVDRQLECVEKTFDLFAGCYMGKAGPHAQRRLVDIVQGS